MMMMMMMKNQLKLQGKSSRSGNKKEEIMARQLVKVSPKLKKILKRRSIF